MSALSLDILGLARDCQETLPIFFSFVDELRRSGISVRIFIGENGSRDATYRLLRIEADAGRLILIDTSAMSEARGRVRRMAVGREIVRNTWLATNPESDFVCVVDLDTVMEKPPAVDRLFASIEMLKSSSELFAVSAISAPHYYDLYAYDDGKLRFDSLPSRIIQIQNGKNILNYYSFFKREIYNFQNSITADPPDRCISAFNGICIYVSRYYRDGSYIDDDAGEICEHLIFNRRLHHKLSRYVAIDRNLMVLTPSDHAQVPFLKFVSNRVEKLVRRFVGGLFR